MYASVRKYRVEAGRVEELMRRVDEKFAPRIESEPGFVGYQAIDCGRGVVVTVSTFSDYSAAERSAMLAREFIADELWDLGLESIEATTGPVSVSRAASQMLEPAHV
jgi:hypothetical protein